MVHLIGYKENVLVQIKTVCVLKVKWKGALIRYTITQKHLTSVSIKLMFEDDKLYTKGKLNTTKYIHTTHTRALHTGGVELNNIFIVSSRSSWGLGLGIRTLLMQLLHFSSFSFLTSSLCKHLLTREIRTPMSSQSTNRTCPPHTYLSLACTYRGCLKDGAHVKALLAARSHSPIWQLRCCHYFKICLVESGALLWRGQAPEGLIYI